MERTLMPLDLPGPIAVYFDADGRGADAVARCFTEQGSVTDEGHTYTGRAAIAAWKAAASAKYNYTAQPLALKTGSGMIIVTSRITGDFPGSPIDLRYIFHLDGDRIGSLEIAP
jgi:hypothetical protein